MTQMTQLVIRSAVLADAATIADLLNRAYRGESSRAGWTTEADLIDGLRTTPREITELIQQPNIALLVGEIAQELVATICCECIEVDGHYKAKLGMIAVKPTLQNQGLGKQMILAAEAQARSQWSVQRYCMAVVTVRDTLIAFYQRLGYQPTGLVQPFPYASDLWQVKVDGLQFEYFEKPVSLP